MTGCRPEGVQLADNVDSKASERRQTIRWNFKISNIDAMLSNVAVGMVTPFIPVFAIALGGSNTEPIFSTLAHSGSEF